MIVKKKVVLSLLLYKFCTRINLTLKESDTLCSE